MKLVSYLREGHDQLALLVNDRLFNMDRIHPDVPNNMSMFLQYWEESLPMVQGGQLMIEEGRIDPDDGVPIGSVEILPPVPFPSSCRDAYAFRQHVASARRNRRLEMIPEFDQFPVFYFSNHHSIKGPGEIVCMPDHFEKLDFELEVAIVIGKQGRNIRADEADSYIAGFMIMNDLSARTLQMEEMVLNLGPAKGKDFATATGPWLVTPDELERFQTAAPAGHSGKAWSLKMACRLNGQQVSEGNLADMSWTFAEIIERASYGVDLFPGDIIGSGTVGTGCFLELNGTGKLNDPGYQEQWIKEGDVVELEVEGLGVLKNKFVSEDSTFSLLALKKKPQ
jgi:fumarylacetoacetate (FAA) hydrolase